MSAERCAVTQRTQKDKLPAQPDLWSLYLAIDQAEDTERTRMWKRLVDLLSVEFADALSQEPSALVVEQVVAICLMPIFNGWRPGCTADVLCQIASLLKQYELLVETLISQSDQEVDDVR